MSYNIVFFQGTATVTVAATESIAVQSDAPSNVFQQVGFPQFPEVNDLLGVVENKTTVFGPFTNATDVVIQAGASGALYATGSNPTISNTGQYMPQGAPATLNATGTLTAAQLLTGLITSTSVAAVAATLPTGTLMDAASEFAVDEAFEWAIINTGPSTFTVLAGTDHTIVGVAAVATVTSVQWRTRKTAANTFVSYRIS